MRFTAYRLPVGLCKMPRALPAAVAVVLLLALGSVAPAGAATCPNEAFRIGPSAALPDCRAYELVSPPDKNGGEVDGGVAKGAMVPPEQAAVDGEAITYASSSAFVDSEPVSADVSSQYLSRRTSGGWQTRAIVPVQELPGGRAATLGEGNPEFSPFQGFNEDLSDGFLLAWDPQPDPAAPLGYFNPYLRNDGKGSYQLLSEAVPPVQPAGYGDISDENYGVMYGGMSANGEHVIFQANDALTAEAVPGRVNLYEWSAGRPLELVSVLPEGAVDTSGGGWALVSGLTFGWQNVGVDEMPNLSGALSDDGLRAFWQGGPSTNEQLYMHEIMGSGARTVEVSASQNPAVANGSERAHFWTASRDGSRVFFTSTARLTEDSTAVAGEPGSPDLYEYDVNRGVLRDLSVDPNAGEAASVTGVAGAGESEGVQFVYFAARGVLAPGAVAGAENVYVVRGSGAPVLVASLGSYAAETVDFNELTVGRTSRVSPDGERFVFQSVRPLTGYDNIPATGQPCPQSTREHSAQYGSPPEGRCVEVFEYDARDERLVCASCNPSGLPPVGNSDLPETLHLYEPLNGWESATVQQRYLLDDGRMFFQSEDALLARATDGRLNVYEFEPEGVGQCASVGVGGCLYLISTGESSGDSYFADSGAEGRDAFFLTSQQLVSQDGDQALDLYDARESGGLSTAVPPPCGGEACKPAITPAPGIYGAPSSATFQGAGNIPTSAPVSQSKAKKAVKKKKRSRKRARGRAGTRSGKRSGRARKSGLGGRSERGRR